MSVHKMWKILKSSLIRTVSVINPLALLHISSHLYVYVYIVYPLWFFHFLKNISIMFIFIVFIYNSCVSIKFGRYELFSCLFAGCLLSLPRGQSRHMIPRLGDGDDFYFSIVEVHFLFGYLNFIVVFPPLISNMLRLLLLYMIRF